MIISEKLKERFCKDCNIPIRVFKEPYFSDRIQLFDPFYHTLEKWDRFISSLAAYENEQTYFEEYNRVKDNAIIAIKETNAYQKFNLEDMNQYQVKHKNLPRKDIFKPTNNGRIFVSIDMQKANFSALRYYDENIFAGAVTWEDFIRQFTANEHIINSKYIRQVILGNCNPKRHITYEKYLMDQVVNILPIDRIVFFSNDEIVLDISDLSIASQITFVSDIECAIKQFTIPFHIEHFSIHYNAFGYYKEFLTKNTAIEFKCVNSYQLPFMIRKLLGQEITDSDKVFMHEGLLAQFIELP